MREILGEGRPIDDGSYFYPGPDSPDQLSSFLEWDDYRVMGLLANNKGGEHGKRLMTRNHYRLICELEEDDSTVKDLDASQRRNKAIVESLSPLVKHESQPKTLWYKTKANNELMLVDDDTMQQAGFLSQRSALMKSINLGSSVFVYADRVDVKAARDKYQELLRKSNELVEMPPESSESSEELTEAASAQGQSADVPKPVQRELLSQKGLHNAGKRNF